MALKTQKSRKSDFRDLGIAEKQPQGSAVAADDFADSLDVRREGVGEQRESLAATSSAGKSARKKHPFLSFP